MPESNALLFQQALPISQTRPIRVLGIDLGTTNCTAAEISRDPSDVKNPVSPEFLDIPQPTLEGSEYSNTLLPSVLALHQGRIYIGEGARRLRAKCGEPDSDVIPEKTIFWEEKNFMGVPRTLHKAPKGYQSAKEIVGHIVGYLYQTALDEDERPPDKIVVTVPASFQVAQRRDTLLACELAGLDIEPGDLLDEPIAAFLHFLSSHIGTLRLGHPGQSLNCLIFDFGGGTCDTAIFRVRVPHAGESLEAASLAVSRYHKLGGGDIDKAIVYEILIPQLINQNKLSSLDLDFDTKKYALEPALLSIAEMLKIGVCREIDRLDQLGTQRDPAEIIKTYPGRIECPLPDGLDLPFDTPSLSADQLAQVLSPFLDTDIPYHTETEYRWTCSVFVPLQDALFRAGLSEQNIDFCLLAGGSSLIPQVRQALGRFFKETQVHALPETDMQTVIAGGACLHAFMLQTLGRSLIQPCSAEPIFIQTESGPQNMIPARAWLPYPGTGEAAENTTLVVPETHVTEPLLLRIELLDGQGRILGRQAWEIEPPVNKGEAIALQYAMDANQNLNLQLRLPGKPENRICELELENPATCLVNPHSKRQEIVELEEAMRTQAIPPDKQSETAFRIADLYQEIGHREKSVSLYQWLLRIQGPNAFLLNKIGMLYGEIGDYTREEKYYLEAERY